MPQEATEIEVEVVEIDGVAPAAPQVRPEETPQHQSDQRAWQGWQGRVRQLDSRWWPLWVLLGIVALALALTVGVVLGAIYVVLRVVTNLIRAILR